MRTESLRLGNKDAQIPTWHHITIRLCPRVWRQLSFPQSSIFSLQSLVFSLQSTVCSLQSSVCRLQCAIVIHMYVCMFVCGDIMLARLGGHRNRRESKEFPAYVNVACDGERRSGILFTKIDRQMFPNPKTGL